MRKIILSLNSLFLLISPCLSQVDRIVKFSATLSGQSVIVNWVVGAGSTCQEVVVQRSIDSVNFRDVYTYPSICGDSDEPESYNWIDQTPINYSYNYYRMKIEGVDFTNAIKVDYNSKVIFGEINIFPNPIQNQLEFWFENNSRQKYQFRILDYSGKEYFVSREFVNQQVIWNANDLLSGVYILELKNLQNLEVIRKKFIKV